MKITQTTCIKPFSICAESNRQVTHLSLHVSLSVRQLHREFLRAGANVIQTFTFYCSEDKLELSHVTGITVSAEPLKSNTTIILFTVHH